MPQSGNPNAVRNQQSHQFAFVHKGNFRTTATFAVNLERCMKWIFGGKDSKWMAAFWLSAAEEVSHFTDIKASLLRSARAHAIFTDRAGITPKLFHASISHAVNQVVSCVSARAGIQNNLAWLQSRRGPNRRRCRHSRTWLHRRRFSGHSHATGRRCKPDPRALHRR